MFLSEKVLRVISDCHCKSEEYLKIINDCKYSIQIGDLSFNYDFLKDVDSTYHVYIKGNHDNYDITTPHNLGDYGEFELNGIKGFFIRGAFSIDWKYRLEDPAMSWWQEEQLSIPQLHRAVQLYKQIKPDFMLSHDFPTSWARKFGSKKILSKFGYDANTFETNTGAALQECFDYHKPKLWIGGHFHFHKNKVWHGTRFICQPELGWTDINEDLEVISQSFGSGDHPNYK